MAKGASVSISDRSVHDATLESSLALIDSLTAIGRDGGSRGSWKRDEETRSNTYTVFGDETLVENFKRAAMAVALV